MLWGEPGVRVGSGQVGSKMGRLRYFGVGSGGKRIAVWTAKESSACCGVNLAARVGRWQWSRIPKMGRGRYFGVERRENLVVLSTVEESSACCGVNLAARSWVLAVESNSQNGNGDGTSELSAGRIVVVLSTVEESSACCGVNLAARVGCWQWNRIPKMGRAWHFGVEGRENHVVLSTVEESSACCGVNLARSVGCWQWNRIPKMGRAWSSELKAGKILLRCRGWRSLLLAVG